MWQGCLAGVLGGLRGWLASEEDGGPSPSLTPTEHVAPWRQTLPWVCLGYCILAMKSEAVLRAAFRSSMLACLPARNQRNNARLAPEVPGKG